MTKRASADLPAAKSLDSASKQPKSLLEALLPAPRRRRMLRELGARFEPNGRDEYHYCEGDRRLPIYAERLGGGDYDVEVSLDGIGDWLPPHVGEPLDEAKKRAILELFLRYLDILDLRVARKR